MRPRPEDRTSRLAGCHSGDGPRIRAASQTGQWPNWAKPLADRPVMREEQEDQVVADGPRIAPIRIVDAGPMAIDDQSPGLDDQPSEAQRGQDQQGTAGSSRPANRRRPSITVVGSFIR